MLLSYVLQASVATSVQVAFCWTQLDHTVLVPFTHMQYFIY